MKGMLGMAAAPRALEAREIPEIIERWASSHSVSNASRPGCQAPEPGYARQPPMRRVFLLSSLAFLCACAEPPPPQAPEDDLDWLALDTGRNCAQAAVACGPGNCAANVENTCNKPVTCDLRIECICRALTGEEGPAMATSGEYTILAGGKEGLSAKVICDSGDVLATIARTVRCY